MRQEEFGLTELLLGASNTCFLGRRTSHYFFFASIQSFTATASILDEVDREAARAADDGEGKARRPAVGALGFLLTARRTRL
jgi:hypothetical protein